MVSHAPPARIVPWVSGAVYGIVLLAGLYYVLGGLDTGERQPARVLGFVAGIGLLFVLDVLERRRSWSRWAASWFLLARSALFFAVVALDESSLSRVLFVLVPFAAYLTFGRAAGLVLGALCLALLVVGYAVWVPQWYRDVNYTSDLLMFGMGLVLAIAMADVAAGERRAAARIAELSATAERNRLARDLHDSLGHHLTAISIQLEKASVFQDRDPAVAGQALAAARGSVQRALSEVRASVGTLRAEPVPLRTALADLVEQAGDDQLEVTFAVEGEERDIDQAAVMALYRAAQEAITNARRHGRARQVAVALTFDQVVSQLVVTDDGRGFDPDQSGGTGAGFGSARSGGMDPGDGSARSGGMGAGFGSARSGGTGAGFGSARSGGTGAGFGPDRSGSTSTGFGPDQAGGMGAGFGLAGLRERAALVGGVVEVDSRIGEGTRVTVTVPHRRTTILGT